MEPRQSKQKYGMPLESRKNTYRELKKRAVFNLTFCNLGANLMGFASVILVNFFTPANLFEVHKKFIFEEGAWLMLPLLYPIVIFLAGFVQHPIQRPI